MCVIVYVYVHVCAQVRVCVTTANQLCHGPFSIGRWNCRYEEGGACCLCATVHLTSHSPTSMGILLHAKNSTGICIAA